MTNQVAELDGFVSTPKGSDSSDAAGTLRLKLQDAIVTVAEVDVTGTIYEGTSFETQIRIHLVQPE